MILTLLRANAAPIAFTAIATAAVYRLELTGGLPLVSALWLQLAALVYVDWKERQP